MLFPQVPVPWYNFLALPSITIPSVCPTWTLPVNEPVVAVIAPCKNTFSVNNPKPGDAFP